MNRLFCRQECYFDTTILGFSLFCLIGGYRLMFSHADSFELKARRLVKERHP